MKRSLLLFLFLLLPAALTAQTADEIIAKYIKNSGGIEKIRAAKTLRRTGKFSGGGGFEAGVAEFNKRPGSVRQEFTFSGLTGVTAYDGKTGWRISPWGGKKDPEPLGEEELMSVKEDAEFDGPLIDYKEKGNKVEYIGTEPVEGTDAYKLKVTSPNGEVRYYYMDTDYYVPIKIDIQRTVRGSEQEYEVSLGDYKEVNGWYLPFSVESNVKGSQDRQKTTYEKIEANVPVDDALFAKPAAAAAAAPGK